MTDKTLVERLRTVDFFSRALQSEAADRIEELEARIDKVLKHLPERPGMAMGFLLKDNDDD